MITQKPIGQLNGFFGSLLKTVIKGVVASIALSVGGPIFGSAAAYGFNRLMNNWTEDSDFWNVGSKSGSIQPNQPGQSQLGNNEAKNKEIAEWIESKLNENWRQNFFVSLSSQNPNFYKTDVFRVNLNKTLLKLEALRLFYKGQTAVTSLQPIGKKSGFVNENELDQALENAVIKNKADIFYIISLVLRNNYERMMKEAGQPLFVKKLKNFKANDYAIVHTPEFISFDFKAKTDVYLYVASANENANVKYKDGMTASTANSPAESPNTPLLINVLNEGPSINELSSSTNQLNIEVDANVKPNVKPNVNNQPIWKNKTVQGVAASAALLFFLFKTKKQKNKK